MAEGAGGGAGGGALARRRGRAGPGAVLCGCSGLAGMHAPLEGGAAAARAAGGAARAGGGAGFDTAPHYGLGLSEERLGEGLRAAGGEAARVWTKVGRLVVPRAEVAAGSPDVEWGNTLGDPGCIFPETDPGRVPLLDYSAAGARRSLAESRARLGPGRVVGLRVHDCEAGPRLEAALAPGGALEGLAALKAEGAVESGGVGVNCGAAALEVLERAPAGAVDCIMLAGCWNLLDQSGHAALLACQRRGVRVHNAGVFGGGLLAGGANYRYAAAPAEIVARARAWEELAEEFRVPLLAVALHFAFLPAVVEAVAVGVKSAAEVEGALDLLSVDIPERLWAEAVRRGLLPEDSVASLLLPEEAEAEG